MSKQFNQLPEGTFCISGGDRWEAVSAKTLRGAKMIASRTFQRAVGGKIEIGQTAGYEETFRVEQVSVKYGYDNWIDTP